MTLCIYIVLHYIVVYPTMLRPSYAAFIVVVCVVIITVSCFI